VIPEETASIPGIFCWWLQAHPIDSTVARGWDEAMNWPGMRTLCGIGVFVFGLLLLAHLLDRLEPHTITTLLVAAAGYRGGRFLCFLVVGAWEAIDRRRLGK
jgi:hypothetical protein